MVAVTGTLPPDEREERVSDAPEPPATGAGGDRLPLRGHQPAGQGSTRSSTTTSPGTRPGTSSARGASTATGRQRPEVRTVLFYGEDNAVDGVVLQVLLRKAETIRKLARRLGAGAGRHD